MLLNTLELGKGNLRTSVNASSSSAENLHIYPIWTGEGELYTYILYKNQNNNHATEPATPLKY